MEKKVYPLQSLHSTPLDLTKFVLDTGRIRLRPISMDDAGDCFREFTKSITRYMYPKTPERIEETQEFIRLALALLRSGEDLHLVICDSRTGEFLGCCGLHGRGKPEHPELGVWVKAPAHGNGYGKEAITALKQWADSNLRYEYLTYPVDRRNAASRRVPESLGGVIFKEGKSPKGDGGWLDEVVYRIPPGR